MRIINLLVLVAAASVVAIVFGDFAFSMGKHRKTHVMAVLGDSISAATFADTSVNTPEHETLMLGAFSLEAPPTKDQIKTEFLIENKDTLSWASGRSIDSNFFKLRNQIEADSNGKETLDVLNLAVPGNETKGVIKQAEELVKAMKSGKFGELKYVTLMIGANDACSDKTPVGTPNEQMAAEFKRIFWILSGIKQKEPIRIFVASIPRIPDLGAKEFLETKTLGVFTCELIQTKIIKACNPMLVWSSGEEYDEHMAVVNDKNRLIEDAVRDAALRYPNLDIFFGIGLSSVRFYPYLVAADCFHPNKLGQQAISDLIWAEQPWFR